MSETASNAQLQTYIDRLEAATTANEFAAILAEATDITDPDKPGVSPGFGYDYADGIYYNGHLFGVIVGGQWAFRDKMTLTEHAWDLWRELFARQRDERYAVADAAREAKDVKRGRPEIGRPVQVRLPDWLLTAVDAYADANDLGRAEAVRTLVAAGLKSTKASA